MTLRAVPIAGRIPPHDLDAEAAVLSAILLDRDSLDLVIPLLRKEHFYSEANGRIYEVAVDLAASGTPVDIVSVGGKLRDNNRLAQVGGAAYLAQLVDAVPSVGHIETYANMVREKWRVRTLIATCQQIAAEGYGDYGDPQRFIDQAGQSVYDLTVSDVARDFVAVGPAVQAEFQRLAEAASRGERLTGISTGFERLDAKMAGLHLGDLTIVAARPGLGKSSFALNVGANVVSRESDPRQGAALFSLEMPLSQLSQRLLCSEGRIDLGKARQGFLQQPDWVKMADVAAFVADWPLYFDDTPGLSVVELSSKLRKQKKECARKGIRLVLAIVDYIQLMVGNQSGSREQEISSISRGLKRIAKELEMHIIALSQLNRGPETRGGKDKRPHLSDLRESGAIEQDADNVIFLFREDYYDKQCDDRGIAELIVAKQRNGPTGKVKCRFEGAWTRFDNLAAGEAPEDFDDDE